MNNKEVDFVAEKAGERMYLQVAYLLNNENVLHREFDNLAAIRDHYPKYVITLDDVNFGNREGIMHKQAWEFID